MLELLKELFSENKIEKKLRKPPKSKIIIDKNRQTTDNHFMRKVNPSNCILCYRSDVRSSTVWECKKCKVHLCVDRHDPNCFELWHTLEDVSQGCSQIRKRYSNASSKKTMDDSNVPSSSKSDTTRKRKIPVTERKNSKEIRISAD